MDQMQDLCNQKIYKTVPSSVDMGGTFLSLSMSSLLHDLPTCLEAPSQAHLYPTPLFVSLWCILHCSASWKTWVDFRYVLDGLWQVVLDMHHIGFKYLPCLEASVGLIEISFNPFCLLPGARLNDGQWHSVSLTAKGSHLSVMVDGEAASMAHSLRGPIESGDTYYLGGKWKELGYIGNQTIFIFPAPAF